MNGYVFTHSRSKNGSLLIRDILVTHEHSQESIHLSSLQSGCPGITPTLGKMLTEACSVVLDSLKAESPTTFNFTKSFSGSMNVYWDAVDDQMRRSYDDLQEATEEGAVAIATLIILNLTEFTIVKRSRKGTGFDYVLGDKVDPLFQRRGCLEVSGIRENPTELNSRCKEKITQVEDKLKERIPVFVIVVEFSTAEVAVIRK